MDEPYSKRRQILERIEFRRRAHVPEVFDDEAALFEAVCEQELEGVVAKRRRERYRPGERAWVKSKNRDYWRWEMEREGALKVKRPREFVQGPAGGSPVGGPLSLP